MLADSQHPPSGQVKDCSAHPGNTAGITPFDVHADVSHVVLEAGAETSCEALEAWGRERLARFKIPSQWVFENDLPKTASGKVQKHKLGE